MFNILKSNIKGLLDKNRNYFESLVKLDEHFAFPWSYKKWTELGNLENYEVVFAVDEESSQVVSFILFEVYEDEQLNKNCYIHKILTLKDFRKNGLGSKLMQRLKEYMLNDAGLQIYLDVEEANLEARSFYAKHGFKELFIKKKFYSNGDNGVYCVAQLVQT